MNTNTILVINPGSTSTKIAVFKDDILFWEKGLSHDMEELKKFPTIFNQLNFRKQTILDSLSEAGIDLKDISAVAGRGGILKSVPGGTFAVNELMLKDLEEAKRGEHASNLGAVIANDIAQKLKIQAYIIDPVVVDELDPIARISGLEGHERLSMFHALNQKAVARRTSKSLGIKYEESNFIVAHLGGGFSVGAHKEGRVVDVNNALYGEGPFSPERCGGLPTHAMLSLCFNEKLTEKEVKKKLAGEGGLVSYFGTNDARKVCQMIEQGDEKAALIYQAMAYQVAKEIASCAAVLKGKVDAITITGGIARDEDFIGWIKERVSFIGEIIVIPGEHELEALAEGALRVLTGEEKAQEYV